MEVSKIRIVMRRTKGKAQDREGRTEIKACGEISGQYEG